MTNGKASVFIVDGWMRDSPGGRLQLLGQRCEDCGIAEFPATARCKACGSERLAQLALGPEAELHSVTVDRMGTFLGREHLVGQVQFAEGPFVQGFVDGQVDDPPPIGCRIELVPFELESDGESVLTYAFRRKEA